MKHWKKIVLSWGTEFGPIIAFFITSELWGLIIGSAVFVVTTTLALLVACIREKRLALFPLLAGISVIIFGVATVVFENPFFIIIKDTFYNGVFAIMLFAGLVFLKKSFLKNLFSSLFKMSDRGWRILTIRWCVMFTLLTISNEIVWRYCDADTWLTYKMWATLTTIIFGFYQITLARRERLPEANKWGMNVR